MPLVRRQRCPRPSEALTLVGRPCGRSAALRCLQQQRAGACLYGGYIGEAPPDHRANGNRPLPPSAQSHIGG